MYHLNENNIFLFLLQFLIILGSSKLIAIFFNKIKQPTITSDILIGVILGPTIFGRFFPAFHDLIFPANIVQRSMLETIGWFGNLLLLLVTGLEVNFASVWRQKKSAVIISVSDIFLPILITGIPIFFLPNKYLMNPDRRILFTVFIAAIMTISALPVAIRLLKELSILKSDMGSLIVSALSLNDIVGWLLFTIILGIFSQTSINYYNIFTMISLTVVFTLFALTAGKFITGKIFSVIKSSPIDNSAGSLTYVVLLGVLFGATTLKIGIHSLFGFFIAGIIAGESKDFTQKSREIITKIVYAVFVPIFFVNIGLKVDFFKNFDIFLVSFITIIGIIGRFFAAYIGSAIAKAPKSNRFPISLAHIPGGEMHIVVSLLALESGLISETIFVSIVAGAVISSIIVGPLMTLSLKRRKKINMLDLFIKEGIIVNLKSINPNDAIYELCRIASENEGLNLDVIYPMVLEREELVGTAVGKMIAVPHGRIPKLNRPVIIFGRSTNGIDWNSPDGLLTKLVFLILTPLKENDTQLQILASISKKMLDDDIRNKLINLNNTDGLWSFLQEIFK